MHLQMTPRGTPFEHIDLATPPSPGSNPSPAQLHRALVDLFTPLCLEFYLWTRASDPRPRWERYQALAEPALTPYPTRRPEGRRVLLTTSDQHVFTHRVRQTIHPFAAIPVGAYGESVARLIAAASQRLLVDFELFWGSPTRVIQPPSPGTLGAVAVASATFWHDMYSTAQDSLASIGDAIGLLSAQVVAGLAAEPLEVLLGLIRDRLTDEFARAVPFTYTSAMGVHGTGFPMPMVRHRTGGRLYFDLKFKQLLAAEWRLYAEEVKQQSLDLRLASLAMQGGQRCPGANIVDGYSAIDYGGLVLASHLCELAPQYLGLAGPVACLAPTGLSLPGE